MIFGLRRVRKNHFFERRKTFINRIASHQNKTLNATVLAIFLQEPARVREDFRAGSWDIKK